MTDRVGRRGQGRGKLSGIIWLDDGQQRFSIDSPSEIEAIALLKQTYGDDHYFLLTDEEAANRIR